MASNTYCITAFAVSPWSRNRRFLDFCFGSWQTDESKSKLEAFSRMRGERVLLLQCLPASTATWPEASRPEIHAADDGEAEVDRRCAVAAAVKTGYQDPPRLSTSHRAMLQSERCAKGEVEALAHARKDSKTRRQQASRKARQSNADEKGRQRFDSANNKKGTKVGCQAPFRRCACTTTRSTIQHMAYATTLTSTFPAVR